MGSGLAGVGGRGSKHPGWRGVWGPGRVRWVSPRPPRSGWGASSLCLRPCSQGPYSAFGLAARYSDRPASRPAGLGGHPLPFFGCRLASGAASLPAQPALVSRQPHRYLPLPPGLLRLGKRWVWRQLVRREGSGGVEE